MTASSNKKMKICEGYYVYKSGRVKGPRGFLKPWIDKSGYLKVDVRRKVRVHQLVMKAFGPKQPSEKHEINHIDGNKQNNNIENLEWLTHQENIQHAFDNGLAKPTYGNKRIHDSTKAEIKSLYETGKFSTRRLSSMYNISQTHIVRVIK
jgi:hypothetical protein